MTKINGKKCQKHYFVNCFVYFIVAFFCLQVLAHGNLLHCYGDPAVWNRNARDIYFRNPQSAVAAYNLGMSFLCMDRIPEGIHYIELASQGKHIQATYLLALFYERDGTFDSKHELTHKALDKTIFYYNQTEKQIEAAAEYPYGIHEDMYSIEQREHTSIKVFLNLPILYFNKFSRELNHLLAKETRIGHPVSYPEAGETVKSLSNMQLFAHKCIQRPHPANWLHDEVRRWQVQQIQCQAMLHFAEEAIPLETERLALAGYCRLFKDSHCMLHDAVSHQLVDLFGIMQQQVESVSLH